MEKVKAEAVRKVAAAEEALVKAQAVAEAAKKYAEQLETQEAQRQRYVQPTKATSMTKKSTLLIHQALVTTAP